MDHYYFTLTELSTAFRQVVDAKAADRMTEVWARVFGYCLAGDDVVELPSSFTALRLQGSSSEEPYPLQDIAAYQADLDSSAGAVLIRFTDTTLALVAGSSSDIRERLDRLQVDYMRGLVSNQVNYGKFLDDLRRMTQE